MLKENSITLQALSARIRAHCLKMVTPVRASHIGSCLSCVDLLAFLYGEWMNYDPKNPRLASRDRFILSKGHAAAALYATLAESQFIPHEWLKNYCCDGAKLAGHATHNSAPGIEISTGSLGHGLPVGVGMALHAKRKNLSHRVVVLLSDGECDEGSNWEAFLFAPAHQLDNLVVIIDYNKIQSYGSIEEVIALEPFASKLKAMRWNVHEIDGHDFSAMRNALQNFPEIKGTPTLIIAHTIKGKGVSFMEGQLAWHYKSPSDQQLADALLELEAQGYKNA